MSEFWFGAERPRFERRERVRPGVSQPVGTRWLPKGGRHATSDVVRSSAKPLSAAVFVAGWQREEIALLRIQVIQLQEIGATARSIRLDDLP